ncbi:fibronectin type III domain-containing protein [Candidatus Halobeggiatoa sp. HSG11]|nr:fibronectin type III domain-containing protein [Candidatus Halobeggiatoa sp. HSG11]
MLFKFVKRNFAALLVLIGLLSQINVTHADIITIADGIVTIASDGQCSLPEAIINANDDAQTHNDCIAGSGNDTLQLTNSTYTLTSVNDADPDGYGPVGLPPIASSITIEGNGGTITRGSGTFRLFYVKNGASLTLQELTLSNGLARGGAGANKGRGGGGGAAGLGGAIFNRGTLTVSGVTFTGNLVQGGNGSKVSFSSSGAGGGGGGLGGNGVQSGGKGGGINGGTAGGGSGGIGGGGGGTDGTAGNGGFGGGGGAGQNGGNGGFGGGGGGGNGTKGLGGFGGGDGGGSGWYSGGGGGAGFGGAIFNDTGVINITNSTFFANEAKGGKGGSNRGHGGDGFGGALFNLDGTVTINNSTFAGNIVTKGSKGYVGVNGITAGGAIYNYQASANLTLNNTILADSTDDTDCENNGGTVNASAINLIESNNGCGTSAIANDPRLGALQDNAGNTQTMALLLGSPAINAGDNSTCESTDQRGETRPKHTTCDIGAYEYELKAPTNLTGNAVSQIQIDLAWTDASSDEAGFKIERNGSVINTTTADANSYNDTSLSCGTTYNYSVKATNVSGDSTDVTVSATTAACPQAPTGLTATATSQTQIDLAWTDASSDETGFKIERNGSLISTTAADANSYNDTSLSCGTSYSYSVKATNVGGDSTAITVSTTTEACPSPTNTGGSTSTPLPSTMTVFTKFGGLGSGTVTSSPSGINCKTVDEECSAKFDTASHVELTAKADSGSIFDRWNNTDCSTKMFLTSSRNCIAYFKLTPRTLTVSYPENGVITSSPSGIDCGNTSQKCYSEFEGGKNISLTATPNTDYMVDSWSQNCSDGKVQLLENTECAATFKIKPVEPIVITPVDPTVPDVVPPTTGTDSEIPTTPNVDEPAIPTNTVSFSEQSYEVAENAENAGKTEITATRTGTEGKVTVELHSSKDNRHEPIAETLEWDDGIEGDINVPITIIDNDKVDGNKEVILSLGATENASLIKPDTSVLTIVDDDKLDVKTPIEEISSTTTSTSVPANNNCSGGNVINTTCDFNWNNAEDVIIEKNGNVSHLIVLTDVKNDGIIGNSEITEGNQVTGGFITGYITNHGILADFEFVGASINGANKAGEIVGILAGKITNTSKVEGFFENVRLASGTHIIGGILSGHIIGDSEQPALLESLIIKSKAVISNVILAEDVELEDGVVFGENIGFSIHINYMESHNLIGLPALGDAIFFKGNARSFARLTGGASENGGPFQRKSTITRKSQVTIKSNLLIDVKHIGKQADILVVALHEGKFYMLNSEGKPVIWNGNISSLIAFQKPENLAPVESIEIWNNPLDIAGSVTVYVGYRLKNGKIVYSPNDVIEMDFVE